MKAKTLLLMGCCVWLTTAQAASEFEMKGLRIGMTETQFKAANPGARCEKAYRDAALEKAIPPMPALRTCSVAKYTLAAKEAKGTQFIFYGGQLGHMFHSFHADDARDIQSAFTEKYGKPSLDLTRNTAEWTFTDSTSLKLRREPGDTVYLFMDSKLSLDYLMRKREIERNKGQKDL